MQADRTWVARRAISFNAGEPEDVSKPPDDYVAFMGKRTPSFLRRRAGEPRYIDFNDVDIEEVDLSAPPPRRRTSRRWSDLVVPSHPHM